MFDGEVFLEGAGIPSFFAPAFAVDVTVKIEIV
jgi:hypothetical protein